MFRSSNPFLKSSQFGSQGFQEDRMSMGGVINNTAMLLTVVIFFAGLSWIVSWNEIKAMQAGGNPGGMMFILMLVGIIGGLVSAMILWFKRPENPKTLMFIYAGFEGLVVGTFSAMAEMFVPGAAIQAMGLTMGIFAMMLFLYKKEIIPYSKGLHMGIAAATGAIVLIYMISFILYLIPGLPQIPFIHSSGLIGIGFSLVVIVIASLSFIIDFNFIEEGIRNGSPKKMEWWGAFGLLVTLIWLYIEILRLLIKLSGRR